MSIGEKKIYFGTLGREASAKKSAHRYDRASFGWINFLFEWLIFRKGLFTPRSVRWRREFFPATIHDRMDVLIKIGFGRIDKWIDGVF